MHEAGRMGFPRLIAATSSRTYWGCQCPLAQQRQAIRGFTGINPREPELARGGETMAPRAWAMATRATTAVQGQLLGDGASQAPNGEGEKLVHRRASLTLRNHPRSACASHVSLTGDSTFPARRGSVPSKASLVASEQRLATSAGRSLLAGSELQEQGFAGSVAQRAL